MKRELIITKKVELSDSDLFTWIEHFFSQRRIKANHSILISHDLTEDLADYLFTEIDKKFNK